MAKSIRLTQDVGSHRAGEVVPYWSYAGRVEWGDPNVSSPARKEAHRIGYDSAAQMRKARAEGRPRANDPVKREKELGGGVGAGGVRIVGTGSMRVIRDELERAAAADQTVAIQATFDAGRGPKTRYIQNFPPGGVDAAGTGPAAGGDIEGPLAPHQGAGLGAPVQLIFGPAGTSGMRARQVLQWIEVYDDAGDAGEWDWLIDLWDNVGS